MAKIKPALLIADDEESMLKTYKAILKKSYDLTLVKNGSEAVTAFNKQSFSLVLLDIMMPEMDGLATLQKIKEIEPQTEVIMVTAVRDVKSAVQAMKLGAFDYITKPFEIDELRVLVAKALERKDLIRENTYLRQALEEKGGYCDMIGKSRAIKQVFETIAKIATADSTVLITGETGSGKELVAHALHKKSDRANKPFVVINCAAIPDSLMEAELFGSERGAYTGATERREGKFELADNGTIFLDEIGCLSPSLQSKLLRVLQDNMVERVGSTKPMQVDIRVVAATNIDLKQAIQDKQFREDLYYRLNIIPIHLPSLRERQEDIPLLLKHFLDKYNKDFNKKIKGFSHEAMAKLSAYNWPGNVRELQNLVERAVVLADNKTKEIGTEVLPIAEKQTITTSNKLLKEANMDFERAYIQKVLTQTNNNQTKAAKILGINRTTLIAKMKLLLSN